MRRLLLAALAAIALLLSMPLPVRATGQARTEAAVAMSREVGHTGLHGPQVDQALVLHAWRYAGVDTSGLQTPDALRHACQPLHTAQPRPAGPASGDYALYRDTTGAQRIGMFLSQLDVAVVDGGTVMVVPAPELDGSIGELAQERALAERGSLLACRLPARLWPGGVDDTSISPGRVALADPSYVAGHLQWAAEHPRDADPSLLHPVVHILAATAEGISGTLTSLADTLAAGASWLLHHLPWHTGAPLLFLAGLLGRTFDGRRLHAVLTAVVLAALGVALGLGWVLPFGWVIVGALLGGAAASAAGVPVLGAIGGALVGAAFAAASFLVGALTGVDGSARVTAGSVAFALVSDLFFLRPAMAAIGSAARLERLGALGHVLAPIERLPVIRAIAGHGHSVLDVAGTTGDALALRPNAIVETARSIGRGLDALRGLPVEAVPHVLADAAPMHEAMSAAEAVMSSGRRGLDLLSLTWRPSSISSDLVGHAADALHLLDTELRTGLPSMPRLRALLTAMDPALRKPMLDAAAHLSTHAVPELRVTARLSHLHSGARTVMGVATNAPQPRPWTRFARSPILRRVIDGLPGARR